MGPPARFMVAVVWAVLVVQPSLWSSSSASRRGRGQAPVATSCGPGWLPAGAHDCPDLGRAGAVDLDGRPWPRVHGRHLQLVLVFPSLDSFPLLGLVADKIMQ